MPKDMKKSDYYDEECEAVVHKAIDARIAICERSMKEESNAVEEKKCSWHYIVEGASPDDEISEYQKGRIRYKCMYVRLALITARAMMGIKSEDRMQWLDCCQAAITTMTHVGHTYIECDETVADWHMELRENGNKFCHPNPLIAAGKIPEPTFMSENPRTKHAFLQHADTLAHRGALQGKAMMDYTNNILVPKAMERHNKEQGDGTTEHPMERGDFLRSFGLLKGRPAKSVEVEADDDEVTSEETIQETIAMPENSWYNHQVDEHIWVPI